jgi:hypothetical protein
LANPNIGVTQIAHRLGVSPAMLYRYIPAERTRIFPTFEKAPNPGPAASALPFDDTLSRVFRKICRVGTSQDLDFGYQRQ